MTGALRLSIVTPAQVLVDSADVRSVRAVDDSGSFGILPGHADLLTVLPPSVVQWREGDGVLRYCAVRGGVFSVTGGDSVAIACRKGVLGDRIEELERDVQTARAAETDEARRAQVEQMRLHARAVRQLMRYLVPGGTGGGAALADILEGPAE